MPKTPNRNDDNDTNDSDQDYESVSKMADRMGLKGRDREKYVHEHMTSLGYSSRRSYYTPEDEDDDGDNDRFGLRKRGRNSGQQSRRNRQDDSDYI